jgi:hypothetical protein
VYRRPGLLGPHASPRLECSLHVEFGVPERQALADNPAPGEPLTSLDWGGDARGFSEDVVTERLLGVLLSRAGSQTIFMIG